MPLSQIKQDDSVFDSPLGAYTQRQLLLDVLYCIHTASNN